MTTGSGRLWCIVVPQFDLVLNLWPQFRPSTSVMALQVRNMPLLHRLARACVDDHAGHALNTVDVVSSAEWRVVGVLA